MTEAIRNTTCRKEGRYGHATIMPGIVIRSEPVERDAPCAICRRPTRYERGPQLVTEGTGETSLVCQNCAFRYDRGIGEAFAAFQEALRQYRRGVTNCDPMEYLADTEAEAVPVEAKFAGCQVTRPADASSAKVEESYFGVCPKCLRNDGYLNIGRDHWYHCREHEVKWYVGSNLFSTWTFQDESTWRANAEFLAGYTEVKEFNPLDQTPVATGDVPF